MTKPQAIFLDKASLYPDDIDFSVLDEVAQWQWFDNADLESISEDLSAAEILVTNKVKLSQEVIKNCPRLKLICVAATGVNNVDIEAAKRNGVLVCNVTAYATASVTQHVFSLILSLNRKLAEYSRSATDGEWSKSPYFCHFGSSINNLNGQTLGIVGYGELGRSVAELAKSFGMKVLIARSQTKEKSANENRVALDVLLAESDVISLHCPLTEDNYHFIGEREFSKMKSNVMIINTARGGLIDEDVLLDALLKKNIAAAGLDVLEEEPPSIDNKFLSYAGDNLIVTPHVAWASKESRQALVNEVAQNITAYVNG